MNEISIQKIDLSDHERVVIIGLGGIGSVAARYLAMFLNSLQSEHTLVLVDGDQFEPGNLYRQFFTDLGNKAELIAEELDHAFQELDVEFHDEFIGPENVDKILQEGSLVLSCVDHHGVRRFIAEACENLEDVTLISGGNEGVGEGERGTGANVQIFIRKEGEDLTPPITMFHPEIADADMSNAPLGEMGCGLIIPSVPQVLFANVAAASAMLNAVLAYATDNISYQEVWLDILDANMRPMDIIKPKPKKEPQHAGQS